jgi:hypothetical protein
VRVLSTIAEGSKVYEEGKSALQLAIDHYDQAVGDLTASIVAGTSQLPNAEIRDSIWSQGISKPTSRWGIPSMALPFVLAGRVLR